MSIEAVGKGNEDEEDEGMNGEGLTDGLGV